MSFEIIKSELKYSGKIVDVYVEAVSLPNGKTALREVVVKGNAAAIVPVDEYGMVTLVRQYRHGAKESLLEIPAGVADPGEDTAVCAKRELEEETGLVAGKMQELFSYHVSPAYCSEVITVFLASDFTQGTQNLDPDEFIEIEKHYIDDVIKQIMDGKIKDSKTICGVLAAKEAMRKE
jgi:ADP-ribose pyrophosphatase